MRAWVVPSSEFLKPRGWCIHLRLMDAEAELRRAEAREAALKVELAAMPARKAKAQAEIDDANNVLSEWRVR